MKWQLVLDWVFVSCFLFGLCAMGEDEVKTAQQPAEEKTKALSLSGKHLRVSYPKALEAYAKALLKIGDAAWDAYRELYGLVLPEPIELQIRLVPEKGEGFAALWTDGQKSIFLEVGSEKPLLSPTKGGAHNVYGICHELGHIAIYSRISGQIAAIPWGVGEGWAHYFGSVITSYLFEKLGAQVYPDPHNYHETSGMVRFLKQIEKPESQDMFAAKSLYEIERKYGREKLGEALNRTLAQRPSGHELVAKFVEALVVITGDPQAEALVPKQFLRPQIQATVSPDIADKRLYYGLKLEWQNGLLRLRYDDGTKDGQWSIGGSGHGIIFCKPEGKWQLVAVEFYGSRYGETQPPKEDFSIFLCDEKFNVVREFKAPYSLFANCGEWKWERIPVEPTEVPDFFYIVIAFNPTATKGIHMAYDADVPRSHSRICFPNSHLRNTEEVYDWMIRCYLRPADEQTAKRAEEAVKRLQSELEALKD